MKKQHLKNFTLRKKTISKLDGQKVVGGSASWLCSFTVCIPEKRK
jgi:hypothetical protein